LGTHLQGTRTGSVRYSEFWERRRQGRGNSFPLPVGPTPRGDIPTVHSMGRSWRRAGYGCSPDIAMHCPRPPEGGGGGAPKAREGWGRPARYPGIPLPEAREGWGGEDMWDLGSVRDRGGGTSSPSPSAPPPVAISTRSTAWGDPGEKPGTVSHRLHPGYGCSPDIAMHCPRPPTGRGRSAEGAGGVGEAGEMHGYPLPQARVGWGRPGKCMGSLPEKALAGWGGEDMWDLGSVRDRGGGTSSPSPSAPPPVAISPRSTAWGDPGEEPDTVAPLISQALPTPPDGGGGGAPKARVGWGRPARYPGIPCRRRRRGGGA